MLAGRSLSVPRETASVRKSPGSAILLGVWLLSATLARQPETDFTYLLDILATNCLDKVLNYAGLGGPCPW